MDLRLGRSGLSGLSGSVSYMESMGQPEWYGVMRGTRLQSLRKKREAVCSVKAC